MWQALEDAINELCDKDSGWWPFLFLRPRRTAPITSARVFLLALLYGLPAALGMNVIMKATHDTPPLHPAVFPLAVVLAFFTFYRVTFALCWNRRAARLAATRKRVARLRGALTSQEED